MAVEVRCPVCQSSFVVEKKGAVTEMNNGIAYLVPETVRHEDKLSERLEKLKAAGVNVDKLKTLMGGDTSVASLFDDDDPIVKELSNGGFIRNPELFRRWITAQTWRLLNDKYGWTHAVKSRFDLKYVLRTVKNELRILDKLTREHKTNDKRFNFFTLDDLKKIIICLARQNAYIYGSSFGEGNFYSYFEEDVKACKSYKGLLAIINRRYWSFGRCQQLPREWLNCFKGAGAYYTLQNLIRTHGLIIPGCKDMAGSLKRVEDVTNEILTYSGLSRRWDILMSLLKAAVKETNFKLKY